MGRCQAMLEATVMTSRTRIDGEVAYLTLTKGYVAVIDVADVLAVGKYRWFALVCGNTAYASRSGCRDRSGKRAAILLHRIILGASDGIGVDHIDGDGLNNRRSNLRLADQSQNACNRRRYVTSISGLKGVSLETKGHKWRARIMVRGKSKYLGYFASKEAAHAAYRFASAAIHGEFGRTE